MVSARSNSTTRTAGFMNAATTAAATAAIAWLAACESASAPKPEYRVSSHGYATDEGSPATGQGGPKFGAYTFPIGLLPGPSSCPSASDEAARQADPRSWYSTVYRGQYNGSPASRCTGSGSHGGVDIRVPTGTPVYAIAPGKIHISRAEAESGGWGELIVILHPGLPIASDTVFSVYGHLSQRLVTAGAAIAAGALIGLSGSTGNSTGPHLHFQIDRNHRTDGSSFSHASPYHAGLKYPFSDTRLRHEFEPDELPAQIPWFTYDPIKFVSDLAAQTTFQISLSAMPASMGVVLGGGTYGAGAPVSAVASAYVAYRLRDWSEAGVVVSTAPTYAFAATANRNLVANFEANVSGTADLDLSAVPAAAGAVSGGGTVPINSSVTIVATPNAGFVFLSWNEGGPNGLVASTLASYSFVATRSRTLVATFR